MPYRFQYQSVVGPLVLVNPVAKVSWLPKYSTPNPWTAAIHPAAIAGSGMDGHPEFRSALPLPAPLVWRPQYPDFARDPEPLRRSTYFFLGLPFAILPQDPKFLGWWPKYPDFARGPVPLRITEYADVEAAIAVPTVLGPTQLAATINGVNARGHIRKSSITIRDIAGETPKTCSFVLNSGLLTPANGMNVLFGLGGLASKMFGGEITNVKQLYDEVTTNICWQVDCVGYAFQLNRRYPIGQYTSESATTVALDLRNRFSSGFTVTGIAAGLPAVTIAFDGTQTWMSCLQSIANLIGGYCRCDDDRDIHLSLSETGGPATIDASNTRVMNMPPLTYETDSTQWRTRVFVYGKSTSINSGGSVIPALGTTILPISDANMLSITGGTVRVGGRERKVYTSAYVGGTGSRVIGPLQVPTPPVSTTMTDGSISGLFRYAVSTVYQDLNDNGAGESELSSDYSTVAANPLQLARPGIMGGFPTGTAGGSLTPGSIYYYVTSFYTAFGDTGIINAGTYSSGIILGAAQNAVQLNGIPTSIDPRVVGRRIWRIRAGGNPAIDTEYFLAATIADNSSTTFIDRAGDEQLVTPGTATNTTGQTVNLIIPVQSVPAGLKVAARNIWRTKSTDATKYYKVGAIAENVSTAFADNSPDSSLSTIPPDSSTAITQTGAVVLRVADTSQFSGNITGGWVNVGGQIIQYLARSTSSGVGNLTGIPGSGAGSIAAPINAGNTITSVSHIVVSPALLFSANHGDSITIYVQRDDIAAQAVIAALEGGDGVHEYPVTDSTLASITDMNARGDAELAQFKGLIVSVDYYTRDPLTQAGKSVVFNLPAPLNIAVTLKILDVTITQVDVFDTPTYPLYHVKASSVRFTLQDLLRQVRTS